MDITQILNSPLVTEKNQRRISQGVYTFRVPREVKKPQIKRAVEQVFQVPVGKIALIVVRPKFKRVGRFSGYTSGYKKAIVYLKFGHRLDFFHPDEGSKTKKKTKMTVAKPQT